MIGPIEIAIILLIVGAPVAILVALFAGLSASRRKRD